MTLTDWLQQGIIVSFFKLLRFSTRFFIWQGFSSIISRINPLPAVGRDGLLYFSEITPKRIRLATFPTRHQFDAFNKNSYGTLNPVHYQYLKSCNVARCCKHVTTLPGTLPSSATRPIGQYVAKLKSCAMLQYAAKCCKQVKDARRHIIRITCRFRSPDLA